MDFKFCTTLFPFTMIVEVVYPVTFNSRNIFRNQKFFLSSYRTAHIWWFFSTSTIVCFNILCNETKPLLEDKFDVRYVAWKSTVGKESTNKGFTKLFDCGLRPTKKVRLQYSWNVAPKWVQTFWIYSPCTNYFKIPPRTHPYHTKRLLQHSSVWRLTFETGSLTS